MAGPAVAGTPLAASRPLPAHPPLVYPPARILSAGPPEVPKLGHRGGWIGSRPHDSSDHPASTLFHSAALPDDTAIRARPTRDVGVPECAVGFRPTVRHSPLPHFLER